MAGVPHAPRFSLAGYPTHLSYMRYIYATCLFPTISTSDRASSSFAPPSLCATLAPALPLRILVSATCGTCERHGLEEAGRSNDFPLRSLHSRCLLPFPSWDHHADGGDQLLRAKRGPDRLLRLPAVAAPGQGHAECMEESKSNPRVAGDTTTEQAEEARAQEAAVLTARLLANPRRVRRN